MARNDIAPISELPGPVGERNRLGDSYKGLPEENQDLVQHRCLNPFGKGKQ